MTIAADRPTTSSDPWQGFDSGPWRDVVDVSAFIRGNYTPYEGDDSFLAGPTKRTEDLWRFVADLMIVERERGILDVDPHTPSTITSHEPGRITADIPELIVGLQTEAPLKRAIMPNGGYRMVENGLKAYGYEPDPQVGEIFTKYRKTHNQGVFDAYTPAIRAARSSHIITGLPDAYGRGRIIGDYRRVALYGIDQLILAKKAELATLDNRLSSDAIIRDREELNEQLRALAELGELGDMHGLDLRRPAVTAQEAIQWVYMGYLGAIKEQNGAAMSLGRVSTFLDVYIQRDIDAGTLSEESAQELVDDFVIKLRMVRFLRTPEYDALFSGDPTWVTEAIGGMGYDGRPLVSRSSFRFLQTLYNLGPAPEPNLTVLWSPALPTGFKEFCAKVSIDTSAIQYESDDLLREFNEGGDDCAIACCVSSMPMGKRMQFFGARVNLAKTLLYAINGGRDEISGKKVIDLGEPVQTDALDFDDVWERFDAAMTWLADTYVNALNIIHYMHDKYAYERLEMALHDYDPERTLACGIAGLSIVADSLSAIKYAGVHPVRDDSGLITEFTLDGEYPAFGNNDPRVDDMAATIVSTFMEKIRSYPAYRDAMHTQSVLTITSNVVYGAATGSTPDGRKRGEPFAPGANPMHGRDRKGLIPAALSVAHLPYEDAQDGISMTASVIPSGLGKTEEERVTNLTGVLDGYVESRGFHMNVNVLNREMLMDAMDNPMNYPQLTIRVSGYAVNFVRLTRQQQQDVIDRTFHMSV
ncbi:MAG: formate C-acetyltransferase [Actinomycetota bacterium]|nr:formate C-acetyltransferase [Actinomycetota bacterium]